MTVGLPHSKAEEYALRLRSIARDERLEVYDPQTDEPSTEDDAAFEAACNPPDTGSSSSDFLSWLQAAERGDPASINNVGDCYRYGSGVEMDLGKAVEWYMRGVRQRYMPAMVNLAECYLNGEGISQDPAEAARLYQEVFEGEQCVSAFELGRLHEAGLGVEKSLERAAEYFGIARANQHPEAYRALKRLGVGG
jgi:TPR repeat protein